MQQYNFPPYGQYIPNPVLTTTEIRYRTQHKLRKTCTAIGFYVLTYIGVLYAVSIGLAFLFSLFNININETVTQLTAILVSVAGALLPGVVFIAATGFRLRDAFGKTSVGLTTLIPLSLIGMAVAMVSNYASEIFQNNISIFGLHNYGGNIEAGALTPFEIVLYVISVAVVPAFAEEFAYRGLVMGSLKKYGRVFAVVTSSILFSAMHANTSQIIFTFFVALVFGFVDMVADSVVPSLVIHFLNNFYAVLFTILDANNQLDEDTIICIHIVVVFLFCLSGFLSFIYLAKTRNDFFRLSDNEKPTEPHAELLTLKNKMNAFFINPGVLTALTVFLALTLLNFIPQSQ